MRNALRCLEKEQDNQMHKFSELIWDIYYLYFSGWTQQEIADCSNMKKEEVLKKMESQEYKLLEKLYKENME